MSRDGGEPAGASTSRDPERAALLDRGVADGRGGARGWRGRARWAREAVTHPIAVALSVVLCVCGLIYVEEARASAGDDGSFARVAHEIWLGSEMPGVKRLIFERNRKVLEASGWTTKLWTEGDINAKNFPLTHATLQRGRAFREITGEPVYSMLVDLMKYEVLLRYGGLYVDTNVEVFRDVTPLFQRALRERKEVFMVSDPGDSRFFSAGMFGAPAPGARVFETLLNSTDWLEKVDFGKRCVANAITGPVWLSHIVRANRLEDTILRLDRDVAYPLGCGENDFDTCVKRVSVEQNNTELKSALERTAVGWQSLNGKEESFSTYLWRMYKRVTTGSDYWNPDKSKSVLLKEADGSFWNTSIPCTAIAKANRPSYAMDHFSFHGASWQDGCDAKHRQDMVIEWLEESVPADESLVHQWALSFVRMLSTAPATSLITRVRLHESGGAYKKARLILATSSLRGGATLLGEALATASNHPLNSMLWERDGSMRSDAYFANYITLGDWWSATAIPKQDDGSWRWKLRKYLLDVGVKEATIDASLQYPGEFVNEVLSRAWEAGIDKVYVTIIGASLNSDGTTTDRATKALGDILGAATEEPVLLCVERANKLDMYVSQARAAAGLAPLQQIREDAEPFDADKLPARDREDLTNPTPVAFNDKAFNRFLRDDKSWSAATKKVLDEKKKQCVHVAYEEDLATPSALAQTLKSLHDSFQLDLNVEALGLLKLERVNDYVDENDFTNVGDLGPSALTFLRRSKRMDKASEPGAGRAP